MRRRHPLPRVWLMTDERMGDSLWDALVRVPRGGGVVFRHYSLPPAERKRLFGQVAKVARRRRLVLVTAGNQWLGRSEGTHNARRFVARGIRTASVHSPAELVRARRNGVDLIFASPIFATRSHAGARVLGPVRLGLMIRDARMPVVALGGMNVDRLRALKGLSVYGWAGIDVFL